MILDKDSLFLFAMKSYDNPSCKTIEEFENDLSKFSYLSRLIYRDTTEENVNTTLNLIITLLNLFAPEVCVKIMFLKVKKEHWAKLKTILVYLSRMPKTIQELQIIDSDIPICSKTAAILRKI